jgi:hypothetical protein
MSTDLITSIKYADSLAKSGLVPTEFQRKPENILFAIEIARDLNVSPVTAMRGVYVLNGRVGFYVHFMLMMANRSGVFASPLRYVVEGEGATLSVTATVSLNSKTGVHDVSESYSLAIATAEGLTRNPKYKTNPVQMLKKRSVRALIDNYCPEVMSGLGSDDPEEDYDAQKRCAQNVTPIPIAAPAKKVGGFDLTNRVHRGVIGEAFRSCGISIAEQAAHGPGIKAAFEQSALSPSLESAITVISEYLNSIVDEQTMIDEDKINNEMGL